MKEYRIISRLGTWPEVFSTPEGVGPDLAYNKTHYPDVEFTVEEREVTRWVPTTDEIPEIDYESYFGERWMPEKKEDLSPEEAAERLAEAEASLDEWLAEKGFDVNG